MAVTLWGVTSADVKQRVADAIHVASASLIAEWDRVVDTALNAGFRDIRTRLLKRGYTPAQLESWDDKESYLSDQALFWALVGGAGLAGYDDRDMNKFDHRKELESPGFGILIAGAIVEPGLIATGGGQVFSGMITLHPGEVSAADTYRTQANRRGSRELYSTNDDGLLDDPPFTPEQP